MAKGHERWSDIRKILRAVTDRGKEYNRQVSGKDITCIMNDRTARIRRDLYSITVHAPGYFYPLPADPLQDPEYID